MTTSPHNPKRVIFTVCLSTLVAFCVIVLVPQSIYPIRNVEVYVRIPTNAPAWIVSAAATNSNDFPTNGWFTSIPYNQATNKLVSESDILEIKGAIPWRKTVGHLCRPVGIVIESSTEARAEFSRCHIDLIVRLSKENQRWEVQDIQASKWCLTGPPDFWERIAEKLPF
jgi:hypothetical protein